jgi:hypothetical protein
MHPLTCKSLHHRLSDKSAEFWILQTVFGVLPICQTPSGKSALSSSKVWYFSHRPFDDFPVARLVRTHALDSALLTQRLEVAFNGAGGFVKQSGNVLG